MISLIVASLIGFALGYFINNPITWGVVCAAGMIYVSILFDCFQSSLHRYVDEKVETIDNKLDEILSEVKDIMFKIK